MPFDAAARPLADTISFAEAASDDLHAAFEDAELDAAWASANPDRALAFLMVSPRPCAALDALLGL
jgi:hypothetical protein